MLTATTPVDLVKKLRRDAAFDPAAHDRGKEALMAVIRREVEPPRRPTIVPQLPYEDIRAAFAFLERAFGFREIPTSRRVSRGGSDRAHGARSPKSAGTVSQYISVYIQDVDAHYQRALAAGARIASEPRQHSSDYRSYEALDLEGHRWHFHSMREL